MQPARHLILPEGEGELLIYDCLVFDGSKYRPETAETSAACFEFYIVTCELPADELIGYYTRRLGSRGWTEDRHRMVISEEVQFIVFHKGLYDLVLHHYAYQGLEIESLWRSPCEPD